MCVSLASTLGGICHYKPVKLSLSLSLSLLARLMYFINLHGHKSDSLNIIDMVEESLLLFLNVHFCFILSSCSSLLSMLVSILAYYDLSIVFASDYG